MNYSVGRTEEIENQPHAAIDFRKNAYLRTVIARPANYDLHKEAFLAPFRETEIWKISPQADGENQSLRGVVSIQLLNVLYTSKAQCTMCATLYTKAWGYVFCIHSARLFQMPGFDDAQNSVPCFFFCGNVRKCKEHLRNV